MKTGVLDLQDGHDNSEGLAYLWRLSGQYTFTHAKASTTYTALRNIE